MAGTSKVLSTSARCLGCAAVGLVVGLTLLPSAAVVAQVPPEIVPSTTTTAPSGPTTTLVPVVVPEEPLPPPEESPPQPGTTILPAPEPTPAPEPPPAPRPAPAAAPGPTPPTSRPTTLTTSARTTRTPLALDVSRALRETASRSAALSDGADAPEAGEGDEQAVSSLPFTRGGRAGAGGALELGLQAERAQQVASLASVAAGLLAAVLLGVVLWVQRQVRHASH